MPYRGTISEDDVTDQVASRTVYVHLFTNQFGSTDRLFCVEGPRGNGLVAHRGSDGMRLGTFSSSDTVATFVTNNTVSVCPSAS